MNMLELQKRPKASGPDLCSGRRELKSCPPAAFCMPWNTCAMGSHATAHMCNG